MRLPRGVRRKLRTADEAEGDFLHGIRIERTGDQRYQISKDPVLFSKADNHALIRIGLEKI